MLLFDLIASVLLTCFSDCAVRVDIKPLGQGSNFVRYTALDFSCVFAYALVSRKFCDLI